MRDLNLLNSLTGLIIVYAALPLVFNTLVFDSFMKGHPRALEEAAAIDGASLWQIFWHVGLLLARPALLTINVFNFLRFFNDLIHPLTFLRVPKKYLISAAISSMSEAMTCCSDWVTLLAAFVIMMIPTSCVRHLSKTNHKEPCGGFT